MAKFVFLAAFLAIIYVADALECYTCDHCSDDYKTWSKISACGNVATSNTVGVCEKIVAKDKTGGENVIRKCAIATKTASGPVVDCKTMGTEESRDCTVCTTDLCNSAPSINFSIFSVIGALSVYLIQKFM